MRCIRCPIRLLFGALLLALPVVVNAKTCLMVYQVADNNLEFYLRKDYEEITQSPAVKGVDLRTWVYHDARNEGRGDPLPNTVDKGGVEIAGGFTGSRYLRYDRSLGKMKVDVELPGEINSDLPGTVQSFLEHAIQDCQSNGYTSLMAVFASHAGGFAGYGGDKSTGSRRARKLLKINLQTNQDISGAIRQALDNSVGTEAKLDVLGFDACLMQAVGAADDYTGVTKYMLASEAVEPGHGWDYASLTSTNSSLHLAQDILETFLDGTHGRSFHQSPKTLSILDTDKFTIFVQKFEALAGELYATLQENDVSLYSFLSRARASSTAYEGLVDAVGTSNPSGLDIGSFLNQLDRLCNPTASVGIALKEAKDAYFDMFVAAGVGPGTSPGTGMHITWPHQGEYQGNVALWNEVLFENELYMTHILPNFRNFLQWFLTSKPSRGNAEVASVCSVASASTLTITDPDALIINATGQENTTTGFFTVDTDIATDVSQMWMEYGIDLTTPLRPFLRDKGYTPRDDEFLFLLGGDVLGEYNGSTFSAAWDQNFYFLNITSNSTDEEQGFEALYVYDEGDGSKKVPVMYFPDEKREEVARLGLLDYLFFDFDFWEQNGATFSFLKFSVDEADGRINENLNLFVSDADKGFSEQPREAGGMIVPLIYVDAFIQGQPIHTLPGGFNQTVISWKSDLNYNLVTTHADRIFDVIPSTDAVIVNVYAFNHGEPDSDPEFRSYDVIRRIKDVTDDWVETAAPTGTFGSGGSSLLSHRIRSGLLVTTLIAFGYLL